MGWGQPAVGKRVHSSNHDNSSSSDPKSGESEEISDPPPYCSKRARELSPELDSICNGSGAMPGISVVQNGGDSLSKKGLVVSELNGSVCRNGKGIKHDDCTETSNQDDASNSCNGSTAKDMDEAATSTSVNDSGSDSDTTIRTSTLRNPNDLSVDPNSGASAKGVRISQSRKGPRVLASKRLTKHGVNRKANAIKRSSTAQSLVGVTDSHTDSEDSDESEVFLDDIQSSRSESTESSVASGNSAVSVDNVPKTEIRRIVPAIRPSYFPFVPPYVNFCMHDEQTDELPEEIRKLLKWRLSPITPIVVKRTVANSGYRLLRKTVEWEGQWGKHMKSNMFRASLKDFQKLNHIPGTFQVGRKDRLWRNLHRFMTKFGKDEFGFLPRTFILPQEVKQLKTAWDSTDGKNTPWIVKPPAAARGTGIRVVNKWSQVPKKKPVIVQSYVANPYLINDRKFDLRLYVLVTDFNPLKIYMYNDGLVRFAPVKYSHDSKRVGDRFMHLTNYSVNKNCELYTHNEDAEACEGHKWTLKTLWRYLKDRDVNTNILWDKMEEIVVKTLLSAEELITSNTHCMPNRYSGYELFGFDIIIDQELKPWLLEVNISPSLHSSSPLDLAVKGPLIKEVFNIVGFHVPMKLSAATKKKFLESLDVQLELETPVFDKRLYTYVLNKEEKQKQVAYKPLFSHRDKYVETIIESLTPDDVRQLILAEDELSQCEGFSRIFPGPNTYTYFPYFENPRYYNMLFDAWESKYGDNRVDGVERLIQLCHNRVHLNVEPSALSATFENQDNVDDDVGAINDSEEVAISLAEKDQDSTEENDDDAMKPMDIEIECDPNFISTTSETDTSNSSSSTYASSASSSSSTHQLSSNPSLELESPSFLATAPTIPLVLDNITNSPRSLIQDVFANSPTIKCHDEDRLSVGNANATIQQPVGDFIKGICF
ncbi:unnamed protein product [Orchesella dallaii]|uniref:Tubulin polyglutamylase TTLL4 n=1 Tax=Orchesella dallaii TaxID=48710 RepID=A0ABP1QTZ0_9HEXA